ncbi:helix-hairpin-helix domain-containing protein [Myxococcus stipitatus]|uniref:helix-hairpin-helix domain-containing protein n=1 Tax=Myxococcus stipitatus TaxID=83455 RepID=UPI001F463459|nr:helix-hairpin-helix domain-containing protein [Myxococcus stipitatus]MCE9669299.1 helix-hairpin-helix domain-containing protein [Myxococcus stipitatus]
MGPLEVAAAPLTSTDVDVAPECLGLLDFVNGVNYATLDYYLPSNVASALIARRTTRPFVSIADLLTVSGMGEARLKQLEGGARAEFYLKPHCVGIFDALAVSADDEAAIVALVNSISSTELHDILPDAWNGAETLLNTRPFTNVLGISNASGIGPVSLRHIRNAATLSRPLEVLITALETVPKEDYRGYITRHFDWWNEMRTLLAWSSRERPITCFGLNPDRVPYTASWRANLATPEEVLGWFDSAYARADPHTQVPPAVKAAGRNNLAALLQGRLLSGCIYSYMDYPGWSGGTVAFFLDTADGFAVSTRTTWTE